MAQRIQMLSSTGSDTVVRINCPSCKKPEAICVPTDQLQKWLDGVMVQDAFPAMTPGRREQFISGICEPCFDRMFAE